MNEFKMNERIAVAVEEKNNREKVAENFINCIKFNVIELDNNKRVLKTEIIFNPLAGEFDNFCQLPAYIKQFNISTIIVGELDEDSIANFLKYNINVISAPGLLYEETINLFIRNKLNDLKIYTQKNSHELYQN